MAIDATLNAAGVVTNSGTTITFSSATIVAEFAVGIHIEDTGSVVVSTVQSSLGGTENLTAISAIQVDDQSGDVKFQWYAITGATTGTGNVTVTTSPCRSMWICSG